MAAGHDHDDVLELGSERGGTRPRVPGGWRPSRGAVVLAAAALAVGLVAGYAARGSPTTAAAPRATVTVTAMPQPLVTGPGGTGASGTGAGLPGSGIATPATAFSFAGSPALTQDVASCATQTGRDLQLGVQVSNQSSDTILLRTARAVLPLGGLKPLKALWSPCGSLQAQPVGQFTTVMLQPGDTTWLSVIFRVQMACPAPMPVQFSVGYLDQGRPVAARLPGFPDLGGVPYSGCQKGTQIAINGGAAS